MNEGVGQIFHCNLSAIADALEKHQYRLAEATYLNIKKLRRAYPLAWSREVTKFSRSVQRFIASLEPH